MELKNKVCNKCRIEKSVTEFHKWLYGPDGYKYNCKSCINNYTDKYIKENPDKYRRSFYKRYYKISLEEYNSMLEKQGNACGICGENDLRNLCVDHDHVTGKVRGLLCSKCNLIVGQFNDSTKLFENAIKYLTQEVTDNV